MNPITYISDLSKNNKITSNDDSYKSPEIIGILVFAFFYITVRFTESYIIPKIPNFFRNEISSLFRLGPVLIPIVFGITYFSKKKYKYENKNESDEILKERMMMWSKK